MSELLRAEHLVKHFPVKRGTVHAVSDVSLTVNRGETLGLVGESGCGKSTLGRMLLNLTPPTSGEIYFKGQALSALRGKSLRVTRCAMQMIFQDPYASLDPRMSVGEIIMEPLKAHRIGGSREDRAEIALRLMAQVGLQPDYFHRYPHQFSGGQRQRIGIARALALNPELIICDEPVSALDVSIQAQILNLLAELQAQLDLTYVFISHDLNVVRYISDRVIVMFLGQVCEQGNTEALYARPLHPYTHFLLEAVPQPDPDRRNADRALLTGEMPSPIDPPPGCRFHTRCPFADERCRRERPELVERAEGHWCACHHPLGK